MHHSDLSLTDNLKHAIVIGSSMAGLVSARVLTNHFERVTIVERDVLAQTVQFRKGVPQGRHPHMLLKRGQLILEELFPGLNAELKADGAVSVNMGLDAAWYVMGAWRPRYQSELDINGCSRPMLETAVRRKLEANPKVTFMSQNEVVGLQTDPHRQQATGVVMRSREGASMAETSLAADLVVDASGRDSRAPQWLEELGYNPPRETVVNAFPGYATRIYEIPNDFPLDWKILYVQPTPPHGKRGGIILPMEGNRWQATLIGMSQDCPPTDEEGYMEFARSLPGSRFYEVISAAKPVSPIVGYRRAENRLRHFDEMQRWLENFVVLGDAVYAFNPVYGQGMSTAAISAMELEQCLQNQRENGLGLNGLAEAFQKKLIEVISFPWQLATGEDMRWDETEGKQVNPDPSAALMQNYFDQVMWATTRNPNVLDAFYRVQNMIEAPSIFFRPDIVLQVAAETGVLVR